MSVTRSGTRHPAQQVSVSGIAEEALDRLADLSMELSLIQAHSVPAAKGYRRSCRVRDLPTQQLRVHSELRRAVPRQGETISTAFVESTINQVVSRRFVKKQQMQ
jgi:hypothetical protein